ncbi:MAG: methyltransferase domain-containing protein [Phenylobacterium sp.]|uniref:RsmB/NOP family class I SAM-dependent RNA methyltransferase n=1 Tax=Phenylobacterium sp. TaxID=1871053 RepID=UPI0025F84D36|nr:RsmB/NOP family class I SAM-dependent RNA methyltransferase [Phenylobacterium sp.]MBI1197277.1 methyltransferase domain-containing protein [Phenylobacterium sp.]
MTHAEPNDIRGLPARAAALEVLTAALARRGGLDEGLSHPSMARLEPRDRAFARALAMATLRRLGPIDAALQARLKKPPPERIVNVLRLGAAQLLVLKVAPHAAVGATVDLAAAQKGGGAFKGLVNAVLRGLSREPPDLDDPVSMAPVWLFARWRAAYGEAEAQAIAGLIAAEPATDVTPKGEAGDLAAALEAEILPGGTLRVGLKGEVTGWPGFAEGRWWVQDASAAVPARLLAVGPGHTALDLCAAPGGKTLQLAAAGASVTAVDRSEARLKRVRENLARTGLSAETVAADAAAWGDRRTFDAVLLDAPCSATGTFRRHPDVLWAASPADIPKLAAVQARLLDSAAGRVKPGGRMVYCVCSLEPEEGEGQVAAFLQRRPGFALDPIGPGEGGAPEASLRPDGTLRILPHHMPGGTDGFYVARLRRHA